MDKKQIISYQKMAKGTPVPCMYADVFLHIGDTIECQVWERMGDCWKVVKAVGVIRYMVDTCEFCLITGLGAIPTVLNLKFNSKPKVLKKWNE